MARATKEQKELIQKNGKEVIAVYEVGSYNSRRLSKPWIAKVVEWNGSHPSLEFGSSGERESVVKAPIGSLVKYGQKDYRNYNQHTNEFGIVLANGGIERVTTAQARDLFELIDDNNDDPKQTSTLSGIDEKVREYYDR